MISVVITTYGEEHWRSLAYERAYPSVPPAGEQAVSEVIVLHDSHLSIGPARNLAASQAKGTWLVFLDADDQLGPGYTEAMSAAAAAQNAGEYLFQPSVSYVRKGNPAPPRLLPQTDLRHDNYLVVGTMLRRRLFEQVGGFEDLPHGFEDFSLWAKCWKAGAKVVPVPDAVYQAHINPQSKHRQMWQRRSEQLYWHLYTQHIVFPEEYPKAPTPPAGVVV